MLNPLFNLPKQETDIKIPKKDEGNISFKQYSKACYRAEKAFPIWLNNTDLNIYGKGTLKDIPKDPKKAVEWNPYDRESRGLAGIGLKTWHEKYPNKLIRIDPIIREYNWGRWKPTSKINVSRSLPSDNKINDPIKALNWGINWYKNQLNACIAIITCWENKNNINRINGVYIDSYKNLFDNYYKSEKINKTKTTTTKGDTKIIIEMNDSGFRSKQSSSGDHYNEIYLTENTAQNVLKYFTINEQDQAHEYIAHRIQTLINSYYHN